MKVSTKGRYALRLMADLAAHDTGEGVRLKEISERQAISVKYLEQIIPLLTRAKLVKSSRGNSGGYRLTRPPQAYTAGEILRATEGDLSPIACLEDTPNQCPRSKICATLPFWEGMKKAIDKDGLLGLFTGGFTACAAGVSAALIFSYLASLIFKPKMKD